MDDTKFNTLQEHADALAVALALVIPLARTSSSIKAARVGKARAILASYNEAYPKGSPA